MRKAALGIAAAARNIPNRSLNLQVRMLELVSPALVPTLSILAGLEICTSLRGVPIRANEALSAYPLGHIHIPQSYGANCIRSGLRFSLSLVSHAAGRIWEDSIHYKSYGWLF